MLTKSLPRFFYLHNLFGAAFLDELRELMEGIPLDSASQNMRARGTSCAMRSWRSDSLTTCLRMLSSKLNVSGCCSDLRFIHYPPGGYISAHETDNASTTRPTRRPTSRFCST